MVHYGTRVFAAFSFHTAPPFSSASFYAPENRNFEYLCILYILELLLEAVVRKRLNFQDVAIQMDIAEMEISEVHNRYTHPLFSRNIVREQSIPLLIMDFCTSYHRQKKLIERAS